MNTIFDLGMFDAADTAYYLELGYRVIAVEANPMLVERAKRIYEPYLQNNRLVIEHAAICSDQSSVELSICGDDLGSSSILHTNVANRTPFGTCRVAGLTLPNLIQKHGVPYYLKIDLEGLDTECVKSLTAENRPEFLSFEVDMSAEELFSHLSSIGFRKYKLINQLSFREIAREGNLRDRAARKFIRMLGFAEPQYIRRGRRLFKVAHSSGPVPWLSDGKWHTKEAALLQWDRIRRRDQSNTWYDVHAM